MSQGFRTLILLAAVLGGGNLLVGHEGHQPLPTKGVQLDLAHGVLILSREAREILDVQTAEVTAQPVIEEFPASVELQSPWKSRAWVTSRLAGRIAKVLVRPGDLVKAGDTLAELESVELQTLIFEYRQLMADRELAVKNVQSLEPSTRSGAVPAQRLVEAQNALRQVDNALVILRSQARLLDLSIDELVPESKAIAGRMVLPILAPIDGRVIHTDLTVGQIVEPTAHLAEVVDNRRVWARIGILERDLYRVRQDQAVRLLLRGSSSSDPTPHALTALSVQLDPKTRQVWGWVDLVNESPGARQYLPGTSGQAWLASPGKPQILSVPATAMLSDGAERYVLVEQTATSRSSEFLKKAVVVGRTSRDQVELLGGDVFPGDRVVTVGSHELASLFVLGVLKISPDTARDIGLEVQPFGRHVVDDVITVTGHVEIPPQKRTFAHSPVAGTVRQVYVDRSQPVAAGEVVADVVSLEFQKLQLDLLRAALDRDLWQETDTRLKAAAQSLSQRQLWEAENKLKKSRIEFEEAREKLLTLGLRPADLDGIVDRQELHPALPLRSPIQGIVVDFDAALGQVIRTDEPLFEIHDPSEVLIQAFVPERHAKRVMAGQRARVRLVSDPAFETTAVVHRRADTVLPETRRLDVWLKLSPDRKRRWIHGLSARVTLVLGTSTSRGAVPNTAVVRDGLRTFVFVRLKDGSFERRRVETGRSDDRMSEIVKGLAEGESVAVKGVPALQTAYAALR